jgi:hypothetical protein
MTSFENQVTTTSHQPSLKHSKTQSHRGKISEMVDRRIESKMSKHWKAIFVVTKMEGYFVVNETKSGLAMVKWR